MQRFRLRTAPVSATNHFDTSRIVNKHEAETKPVDGPHEDSLWTAADVAAWAKLSKSWVYQHAAAGVIPCLKIGGLLRFDPAVVKKFFLSGGVVAERKVIPLNPKAPREGR